MIARALSLAVPLALPLALPLAVLAGSAACSSEATHPPAAGGCTSNCGGGTGGVADGGVEGGVDGGADAPFEAGEAGVSLTVDVHQLSAFPPDPASGPLASNVTVRGLRQGGGTVEAITTLGGGAKLDGLAPSIGAPTWLSLLSLGKVRGIVGVMIQSDGQTKDVPLFDENLPATTSGLTTLDGTATVVLHVTGATGARLAGVTAAPIGDVHPYYDSGKDSVESTATATGANGTVVFIGLTPGAAPVTLSFAGKALSTLTIPTAANAISFLRVAVE